MNRERPDLVPMIIAVCLAWSTLTLGGIAGYLTTGQPGAGAALAFAVALTFAATRPEHREKRSVTFLAGVAWPTALAIAFLERALG